MLKNLNQVREQLVSILKNNGWDYCEDQGIDTIMEIIDNNKSSLREMLRNHHSWSENDQAVIVESSSVTINPDRTEAVNDFMRFIYESTPDLGEDDSKIHFGQASAIRYFCTYCNTNVKKEDIERLEHEGIKNAKLGQKSSRFVNAWCVSLGLDKCFGYSHVFAKLADSLRPIIITTPYVLSIHPVDFCMMSNGNSWSSCHKFPKHLNGGYVGGVMSYAMDDVTMLLYTPVEEWKNYPTISEAPKLTRQCFHYNDKTLWQSRLYPTGEEQCVINANRSFVQRIIAECLNLPDTWVKRNAGEEEMSEYISTAYGSSHYEDYLGKDNGNTLSCLGAKWNPTPMTVGHRTHCIRCGDVVGRTSTLYCCIKFHMCICCNKTLPEHQMTLTHGGYVCPDCAMTCACCGSHMTQSSSSKAYNMNGDLIEICYKCWLNNKHFTRCQNCHSVYDKHYINEKGLFVCPACDAATESQSVRRCGTCYWWHINSNGTLTHYQNESPYRFNKMCCEHDESPCRGFVLTEDMPACKYYQKTTLDYHNCAKCMFCKHSRTIIDSDTRSLCSITGFVEENGYQRSCSKFEIHETVVTR